MKRIGYIPDEVIYVRRPTTAFTTHWDGDTWQSRTGQRREYVNLDIGNLTPDEISIFQKDVMSTFPVSADPKNLEKRLQTAREWAQGYSSQPYTELRRKNEPFSIQIVGLDVRGEGGRAYKVIDPDGHLFDLREDVVFESLMKFGCLPDGYLQCQFLWAVSHQSMKLIRENSILHEELADAGKRREKPILLDADLVPGKIYQTKNLDRKLFVGWAKAKTKTGYRLVWLKGGALQNPEGVEDLLINKRYSYSLVATVTTEQTMIEEAADFTHLIDYLKPFAEHDAATHLQIAESNLANYVIPEGAQGMREEYYLRRGDQLKRSVAAAKVVVNSVKALSFTPIGQEDEVHQGTR